MQETGKSLDTTYVGLNLLAVVLLLVVVLLLLLLLLLTSRLLHRGGGLDGDTVGGREVVLGSLLRLELSLLGLLLTGGRAAAGGLARLLVVVVDRDAVARAVVTTTELFGAFGARDYGRGKSASKVARASHISARRTVSHAHVRLDVRLKVEVARERTSTRCMRTHLRDTRIVVSHNTRRVL